MTRLTYLERSILAFVAGCVAAWLLCDTLDVIQARAGAGVAIVTVGRTEAWNRVHNRRVYR